MYIIEKKGLRVRSFDSITEALEFSKHPTDANKERWEASETRSSNNKKSWVGIDGGIAKVREFISLGWSDGARKLEKRAGELTGGNAPAPINIRRKRQWKDHGDALDITRTYAGISEAWQTTSRVPSNSTKYVEIICNLSINSNINAEVIFWRGAGALILADLMTNAGYSIKITGAVTVKHLFEGEKRNALNCIDFFTVKGYQQPLDINSLASVVCLGGFFRVVWFQLATTHPELICSGWGESATLQELYGKLEPHQISDIERVTDEYSAKQWVESAIKRIQSQELLVA